MAYQAEFDPFAAVVWCRASRNRYGNRPEKSHHPTFAKREVALRQFLLHRLVDAHKSFKRGVSHLQRGNLIQATEAFETYLAEVPTDTEAQYNLALAYFLQGVNLLDPLPWAPYELTTEIAITPKMPEPHSRDLRRARRRVERAKTEAQWIVKHNPSHPSSWRLLGDIALAYGKHDTAREHYQQALYHRPGDPATLNNLGVLACKERQRKKARQHFKACLQSDSETGRVARQNLEQLGKDASF